MGPRVPSESPLGELETWELEDDGVTKAVPGTQAAHRAQGLFPQEVVGKFSTNRLPVGGNFLLQPNQMGESYPTIVYLLGPRRTASCQRKAVSSPEARLCISELCVVERKLFWSHLPKFTFQTWLGAEGLLLELTAQPLVTLWAGPATGWSPIHPDG